MASPVDSLPDDVEALRAFALATIAERDAAVAERDKLAEINDRLRRLLRKAQGFEAKSERLAKLPADQLNLALEDIEQAIAKTEAIEEKKSPANETTRQRRKINRGALPTHLPRVHQAVEPENTSCPCCGKPMHVIGEETSERLDVVPAQYRVIVTHRPKLACRACEKVVEAPAPEHLIKSGIPTEGLVASVLVAKYGWHLPLYRQAKMLLLSHGIELDRSTLAFWVGYAAAELEPLYERLRADLLASAKLAVDETPVPVLDPGRGKTKTGWFWVMARDDRPWAGPDPPAVFYSYAPGRGGEHLKDLLGDYRGIVQCDGYAPYKKLPADRITIAFCWSHLRRDFFEIAERGDAPVATEAVARIAQLYAIEARIRGENADHRRAVRQAETAPLVQAFRSFLERELARVLRSSDLADVIRYGLRHWDGLVRFLDDGRIEMDTNIVERSMRPQSLTKKNALFAGHDDAAQSWAILASLIETCKIGGIDPQSYLADVLARLVNLWPNNRLDELLPWTWAKARQHQQRAA
ncbi:MAG: IS66 family transposase [Alphaproteobacteria bacterium]|nr:IS66 family transposase [Alphaproteobacteria bacterium]MDE2492746.1 IS66 family transposase [Alphaproteobacteria bacterium]